MDSGQFDPTLAGPAATPSPKTAGGTGIPPAQNGADTMDKRETQPMKATTVDFEAGLMNETEQLEQLRKQMETLYQNLRTVRHAINNHVAVIMAMAELSQRNPAQSAKLSQLCLEKAPQIAAAIGGFTELFNGALSMQREVENQTK
jgi:hypothetical protein